VFGVVLQTYSYLARRRGRRLTGMALSTAAVGTMLGSAYLGGHLSFNRGVGVSHTAFEEPVAEWTDVAATGEVGKDGRPLRVSAGGVPVVLVRRGEDVCALSATCVHAGGPLDEGEVLDGSIRCPWHGSIFRLTDGKALRGPAATAQPVWEVRTDGGRVQVRAWPHGGA
ncbi:MAG: Rieske (2Fe-2S) protein, partial [Acidimicrobiales bacterium]